MTMRRFSSRAPRLGLAFACALSALAVTGATSTASAHKWFPGWIQEHLLAGCAPQCTLCHTTPAGGEGTSKTSGPTYVDDGKPSHRGFGVFVVNFGLVGPTGIPETDTAENRKIFEAKLDALAKEPCQTDAMLGDVTDMAACDSDGDGALDYDELKAGNDADTPGAGAECPKYGCGASISRLPREESNGGRAGAVMAALGVGLVLARRMRR
jgi:hypothetical protein